MLCEECNTRESAYTVSVVVEGQITVRHLCQECMSRMNMDLRSGNIKTLLSSILSAISGKETPETGKEDITCPRCQTSLVQFTKTGRLGCPRCYETFREQLQPMLLQTHGRVQHAGRRPADTREIQERRERQAELTRRMEQAVAEEDFETAAQLRDQLRAMAGEGEEHHEQ